MKTETSKTEELMPRRAEGLFYIGMAIVAMAITIAGFGPTMVDTESRRAPLNMAVAAHGAVFGAWLLLFLTQTILIPNGRIAVHMMLGYAGAALAVLMVVSGFATAIAMARRGHDLSGDLVQSTGDFNTLMALQLGDLLSFSLLVGMAVWYRNRPDVHKRLMLLATVGALMPAALAHIIGHSPVLREIKAPIIVIPLLLLLFAGAIHDRLVRGRIHPVSLWVALALFIWSNLRATVIGPSEIWRDITGWLVS